MPALLEIKDLRVHAGDTQILHNLNLVIEPGAVHSIMGPNGSGKSTLAGILSGSPTLRVTGGTIKFRGADLLSLSPEDRAMAGMFLAFQYPVEVPGLSNTAFLKAAINARRRAAGQPEIGVKEFLEQVEEAGRKVSLDRSLLSRAVNSGFSGGEKKRFEVFQMILLQPVFAILDETDSGLDIDALRVASQGVNSLRSPDRSFLVITHYQRLLDHIVPDVVHVMVGGTIVKTGGADLARELEANGYAGYQGKH